MRLAFAFSVGMVAGVSATVAPCGDPGHWFEIPSNATQNTDVTSACEVFKGYCQSYCANAFGSAGPRSINCTSAEDVVPKSYYAYCLCGLSEENVSDLSNIAQNELGDVQATCDDSCKCAFP